jgi:hypothetical protein
VWRATRATRASDVSREPARSSKCQSKIFGQVQLTQSALQHEIEMLTLLNEARLEDCNCRRSNMKTLGSAILVLSALTILVSSVIPAAAAKKSRDECMTLAKQRGFARGGVDQNRAFNDFIRGCMKGTQQ